MIGRPDKFRAQPTGKPHSTSPSAELRELVTSLEGQWSQNTGWQFPGCQSLACRPLSTGVFYCSRSPSLFPLASICNETTLVYCLAVYPVRCVYNSKRARNQLFSDTISVSYILVEQSLSLNSTNPSSLPSQPSQSPVSMLLSQSLSMLTAGIRPVYSRSSIRAFSLNPFHR